MKHLTIFLYLILFVIHSIAQIPKTSIVEHFTNSNCSICFNTNPGILSTLATHPDVLHISFYPSSPYAACVFSMQNTIENDARTNFYNVYGGTPKLILNGSLTSTGALASSLNLTSVQTSAYSLQAKQQFVTSDSVLVSLVIKKISFDTTTSAVLFAGVVEDTVFQTTANGETMHHDVFRRTLSTIVGDPIILPSNINDSLVLMFAYHVNIGWILNRLQTIFILQHLNKDVFQSCKSMNKALIPSATNDIELVEPSFFPNPVFSRLGLRNWLKFSRIQLFTFTGMKCFDQEVQSEWIDVSSLSAGSYMMQLETKDQQVCRHILIKH